MRAFVVGNGPSLAVTNLEHLQDDVSFGVNRIHLIYPDTNWRPTYYVRGEEQSFKSAKIYHKEVSLHIDMGCEVWVNKWYSKRTDFKTHTIRSCWHYLNHFNEIEAPNQWHFPTLCSFGSSVNVAIQIAALEKYNPIYLVGCDLGYKDDKPNHFTPDYEKDIEGDLRPARYANLDTLAAHMVAARSFEGVIYNATIGGELEVYERVDYERLF